MVDERQVLQRRCDREAASPFAADPTSTVLLGAESWTAGRKEEIVNAVVSARQKL